MPSHACPLRVRAPTCDCVCVSSQAFAKSVPTLSLLLSAAQRGAEFIAPACQSLAASPVWSVRAVLCDAIPLCVAAASIQDTNTLSPSTATTTTTATATAALSTLAIGPAKPATHTSHGSQARAAGVADTITRQGAADHPAGSEPDGSGDDVGVGTRTVLLELLCGRLAKDVSHWVRNAAIKAAGPTIAALNRYVVLASLTHWLTHTQRHIHRSLRLAWVWLCLCMHAQVDHFFACAQVGCGVLCLLHAKQSNYCIV